jgi:nucleoside-diphosphate-sugar epimerase
MPRIVFVTGAAGAIGARLLPALRAAGWRTRVLVHRREVEDADEQVRGDLADEASLRTGATGAAAVLHLAALTHARREGEYRAINVDGTARMLAAARDAGVDRFVHVSTRAISPQGGAYSRTKLEAEDIVRAAAMEHAIVRIPEVYGAGGREGVDDMLRRAARGSAIPVVGHGADVLCPVHVDDVTGPLVEALSAPAAAGRTYTLAGECHTAREVAEACASAYGARARVVGVPAPVVRLACAGARFLPLPLYPDQLARLRAEKPAPSPEAGSDLGFAPRPLAEGLRTAGAVAGPAEPAGSP